jgi:hypothetical protein
VQGGFVDYSPKEQQQQMCFAPGPSSVSVPGNDASADNMSHAPDAQVCAPPQPAAVCEQQPTNPILTGIDQFERGFNNDPSVYAGGTPHVGGQADHPNGILATLGQEAGDFVHGMEQEGISGLLDPAGMMDRQAAQRELQNRFQVVPDDFIGPRLPNEVTQSEYQNVAHEYSDIRMGRGDLTIDTSERTPAEAKQYRDGAMNDIANLLQTNTGRAEIAGLSNNTVADAAGNTIHRHTTLEALHQDVNHDNNRSNDGDAPIDTTNGFADPVNFANSEQRADASGKMVNGPGSDVVVRYNPGVTINTTRSDVILAHELRHTMDETHGGLDPTLVQASDGVPVDAGWKPNPLHRWEHQAAGLGLHATEPVNENHYRAERAEIGATETGPAVQPGDVNMPQRQSYLVLP